jgi:hypothetical protein
MDELDMLISRMSPNLQRQFALERELRKRLEQLREINGRGRRRAEQKVEKERSHARAR